MPSLTALALVLSAGLASAAPTKALWLATAGTSWQISLSQAIDPKQPLVPDVDAYDIDMEDTDASVIQAFHDKGKKVICYFSAGSYEPWRSDAASFQSGDMGSVMDGWPDEKWLNIKSANVRAIMTKRIELAASKGCDAIDPDNTDGFDNSNGLGLTAADAIDYVNFLAATAKANGMSTGLKNSGDLISGVLANVHFAVNEQCHQYGECKTFQPFIAAGKPVFNIEYPEEAASGNTKSKAVAGQSACAQYTQGSEGFSTIVKKMDLNDWCEQCPILTPAGGLPAPSASASATVPSATVPVAVPSASTPITDPVVSGSPAEPEDPQPTPPAASTTAGPRPSSTGRPQYGGSTPGRGGGRGSGRGGTRTRSSQAQPTATKAASGDEACDVAYVEVDED